MNERIQELAERAGAVTFGGKICLFGDQDIEKFAELIVQSILDRLETERDYYANPSAYQSLEYYTKMFAKEDALNDAISMIRSDFGVE